MNRVLLSGLLLVLILLSARPLDAAPARPNIIVILVDDMGWTDLGCMGSDLYETPQIDNLAAEGMKFTQAYSACTVCSPTRAAMLTGKYPARLHLTDWIQGHQRPRARLSIPDWTMYLRLEETTLAEALRQAGYATIHIGKWHLGDKPYWPDQQGFDRNVGGYHRGQPPSYFAPYRIPTLPEGPDGEYLTDREAQEAIRFMEDNQQRPFFIYLPHYAVHTPLQGKKDLIEKYRQKIQPGFTQNHPVYAAMIDSLDQNVGRILNRLRELSLDQSTIVLFTSDNGGLTLGRPTPVTSNQPLRAGKGSSYEGGVRVPLIVRWPGVTTPGSIQAEPVMTVDFYPTILEMAGVQANPGHQPDGVSLVPLLRQQGTFKREALYWHYPHYHPGGASPYGAVRQGPLKLIEFYETGHLELYDLDKDIGEQNNLANQRPWKAREMQTLLAQWRASVSAQMPSPNPNYKPAETEPAHYVLGPRPDGSVLLHARDADIHGVQLRYEPQPHKNTLGYWSKPEDWASWDFHLDKAGTYAIEILQGCGPGNGGSQVDLTVHDQTFSFVVQETKGFQDFLLREIGRVTFDQPGTFQLSVKPRRQTNAAVMDLRQVTLKPTGS